MTATARVAPVSPAATGTRVLLAWLALHIAVGLAITQVAAVATLHALVVVASLAIAVSIGRNLHRAVVVLAYATTADVLWRTGGARVPYETGKYLLLGASAVLLARFVRRPAGAAPAAMYLLALLPSAAATLLGESLGDARQMLAFQLSGPVALGVAVLLLRQLVCTSDEIEEVLRAMVGPIVALAAIAGHAVLTSPDLRFTFESNAEASGGFGPNQVSSLLGFGAVLCTLLALRAGRTRRSWLLMATAGWLVMQAFFTFSRGGVYAAALTALAILAAGLRASDRRGRLVGIGLGALALAMVAFWWVDSASGGNLGQRYEERESRARTQVATDDLALWADAPVLGVGVGRSPDQRAHSAGTNTHTEYTRLVAEHGVLGLVALGAIAAMAVTALRRNPVGWPHLVAVALVTWSLISMSHSATRFAAGAAALALSQIRVDAEPSPTGPRRL